MNINLNGPVTITLEAQDAAVVLDVLAKGLTYMQGVKILDQTIFPQLVQQTTPKEDNINLTPPGASHGSAES